MLGSISLLLLSSLANAGEEPPQNLQDFRPQYTCWTCEYELINSDTCASPVPLMSSVVIEALGDTAADCAAKLLEELGELELELDECDVLLDIDMETPVEVTSSFLYPRLDMTFEPYDEHLSPDGECNNFPWMYAESSSPLNTHGN